MWGVFECFALSADGKEVKSMKNCKIGGCWVCSFEAVEENMSTVFSIVSEPRFAIPNHNIQGFSGAPNADSKQLLFIMPTVKNIWRN